MSERVVNYCGLSAGKDSTATALWLVHESGVPRETIRFTFCDTENEHEWVYAHIMRLSRTLCEWGCDPVEWLPSLLPNGKSGFIELAKWKKRFPSRKARFCTQFLKVIPSREDVQRLIAEGCDVTVHSGVRAAESPDREKLQERGFDDMFGCTVNRPILRWKLADVVAIHKRYGVPLNPLYSLGFTRVGCFPCINSKKSEIKLISIHFPERIDEIREQEKIVGSANHNHFSSFFHRKTVPARFRSQLDPGSGLMVATIDDVVRWSHTLKGGREKTPVLFEDFYPEDANLVCPSGMGMCE